MPIKHPAYEADDKKTGMTLDEMTEFIELARAADVPGSAVIEITTVGTWRQRIKTATIHDTAPK